MLCSVILQRAISLLIFYPTLVNAMNSFSFTLNTFLTSVLSMPYIVQNTSFWYQFDLFFYILFGGNNSLLL